MVVFSYQKHFYIIFTNQFSEIVKKKLSSDYDHLKLNSFTLFLNFLYKTKLMQLSKPPYPTVTNLIQLTILSNTTILPKPNNLNPTKLPLWSDSVLPKSNQ